MKSANRRKKRGRRIPALCLIILLCACGALFAFRERLRFGAFSAYARLRFGVETPVCPTDGDNDLLSDWADICLGARAYVRTQPVYDSAYCAGGYPEEGRGVCADVVWRALRAAGYDFKALLDADVQAHPGRYALTGGVPDPNIDFRRVVNLQAYFAANCETLPVQTADPSLWQAGDLVIYEGHVAVCSCRRNGQGLSWIIHHTSHGAFEEDALESRPILGHYRWVAPEE
ncbi:MAG: DUF1287 domain-containing protein [Clostridia bacterium]|nr:DUF1287 domain-containing protein [Clostridia bacterium]